MARRLKVYRTRVGFFETIVAAPSQSRALKAWGVRQNLFAAGEADVVTDPETEEAALEHPGKPLMRAAGSRDAFSLEPPTPRAPLPPPSSAARAKPRPASMRRRPLPDRSALDAAERRLARLTETQTEEAAELARRRASLEEDEAAARRRWASERHDAEAEAARARDAFERAGRAS